jgi:hypothetical protein
VAPLNVRKLIEEDEDPALVSAARTSSTDSFHLAALVSAGLMFAGAVINGFGIRNPKRRDETVGEELAVPGAGHA